MQAQSQMLKRKLNALCVSLAIGAASGGALAAPWTTVGSAGTVDEADVDAVSLSGAGANVSTGAALPRTVVIRYNVVAIDGLLSNLGNIGGVRMDVVYRDNANTAKVRLRLRELENATGILRTKLVFDSNAFAPAEGFQQRSVNSCASGTPFNFDFARKTYYVEAEIEKAAVADLPSLGAIQVHPIACVNIE